MRKTLLHVLPALAVATACSSGVGPIGIGTIGDREDPQGGSPSTGGGGDNGGGENAGSSGGTPGGALSCSGNYTCTRSGASSVSARLRQKSDGCEADISGTEFLLTSDGRIIVDDEPFGTWRTSGADVLVCDADNNCLTCVVAPGGSSGSGSGSGGTDAGSGD